MPEPISVDIIVTYVCTSFIFYLQKPRFYFPNTNIKYMILSVIVG